MIRGTNGLGVRCLEGVNTNTSPPRCSKEVGSSLSEVPTVKIESTLLIRAQEGLSG